MLIANHSRRDDRETQLMLRFCGGDDVAFDLLVDACQDGLIQFLSLLSGDSALGEDLAQEAFIRLYKSRSKYRADARLKTFLYAIAKNLWVDHLRSLGRRAGDLSLDAMLTDASLGDVLATVDPDPFAVEVKELYRALRQVSEDQREVLLLSQIEDMSHQEIATALAIPIGTVKSRIYHAVHKLRQLLQGRATL